MGLAPPCRRKITRRKAIEVLRDDVSARGQLQVLARLVALSPARKTPLHVQFIDENDAELTEYSS